MYDHCDGRQELQVYIGLQPQVRLPKNSSVCLDSLITDQAPLPHSLFDTSIGGSVVGRSNEADDLFDVVSLQ